MDHTSATPLLALLVPLVGTVAMVALRRQRNARELCAIAAGVAQTVLVATMVPTVLDGGTISFTVLSFLPEAPIALRADALGVVLAGTASVLWVLTTVYSVGYFGTGPYRGLTRFHGCFGLTMVATVGAAFAANLVTLYLFYEAMTIVTYPLVTHTGTAEAMRSGRRYLAYQLGSGIAFFLPAIVLTYTMSGTFDLVPGGTIGPDESRALLMVVYVLYLLGIAKAAMMPVHAWLPAAMVAPVPVSALLHAVAVVNVGVFCVFRVVLDVFGSDLVGDLGLGTLTLVVTSVTILLASGYALRLDDLKGILAYSTIGQLSYMILGVALLTDEGRTGGMLHLVGHAFSKITLFFAVGSIYMSAHRTRAGELRGVGRRMPWTMAAFALGALSIIGIPPTVGFLAKYFLFLGAAEAGQWIVIVVLAASTLLSAGYYLRVMRVAFSEAPVLVASDGPGGPGDDDLPAPAPAPVVESPALILVPLMIAAAMTVILAAGAGPLLELIRVAAR